MGSSTVHRRCPLEKPYLTLATAKKKLAWGVLRYAARRHASQNSWTSAQNTRALASAEQEWLQGEEVIIHFLNSTDQTPRDRFDWRLRATSRVSQSPFHTGVEGETLHSNYIKRIQPSQINVGYGELFYEEVQAYKKRFLPLLDAEQADDEAVLKERLSTWSLNRLTEEGYCLTNLSAFWLQANQFGRPVAAFLLGPGLALPEQHRFENGSQILVSRIDPLKEQPLRGSVVSRTANQIKICFPESFDLDGIYRLDLSRSDIVYERMRNAISYFNHDPAALEADVGSADRQLIIQGTHLRGILLRTFAPALSAHTPLVQARDDVTCLPHEAIEHRRRQSGKRGGAFRDDMRIQSWARRYAEVRPLIIEGDPVVSGLNATQIRAMATMIGERISLIQGPPGTGKTKTLIETIKLLKVHFEVIHPLLVCTYTNVAVDNLLEGLAAADVKPLRIGFGARLKASLVEYTLDHKLDQHPLKLDVDKLVKQEENLEMNISDLKHRVNKLKDKSFLQAMDNMRMTLIAMERRLAAVKSRTYALKQEMLRDVISRADVVCTTCLSAASVALNVTDFPVVFLDEASMSTEPASLIPIMKGSRQLALIGDHKQLPPIITSREAQDMGLGISLFERLTEEGVVPSVMLDTQYRMHPSISRFPSSEFYNLSLLDGTLDAAGNISPGLAPPRSRHFQINKETGNRPSVIFLDHTGCESGKDRSRVNINEAHIVCSVVEDLLLNNDELCGHDIGIIAPYVAQVSLLNRLINNDRKYRSRFKSVLGDYRAMQLANVEIKTVDGFEGREKEVIIFSTVRNNAGGHLGFLADRRRLNVGLTRAKRGLFIVGSISTLKLGKFSSGNTGAAPRVGKGAESWRRYAQFLTQEGLVVELSGEKLGNALYGNLKDFKRLTR